MIIDYKDLNELNRYKIMSDTVVPRPIAWIVTEDEGIINIAPFSYFIPISSKPALVVVSIGKKEGGLPKDTLANILKTKKATICFVNKSNIEKVKLSSNSLPKEESEALTYDIKTTEILANFPAIINSTQTALFCEFYQTIDIPSETTPVILEIKKQFIEDDRLDSKNHVTVENIGRCGVSFKSMNDV